MIGPSIILVAGVSGVGKTTLCQRLASHQPGVHHLVASAFVDGGRPSDQMALVKRIRAAAEQLDGACLVDGHLIIGGNRVPQEALAVLAPQAILMVTGSPADILARRAADTTRSRPSIAEEDLRHAQEAEAGYAQELALALGVPFAAIGCRDDEGFRAAIHQMLGTARPQGDSGSLKRYSARPGT